MKFFYPAVLLISCLCVLSCGESSPPATSAEEGNAKTSQDNPANSDPLLIEINDMEKKAKLDSVMDRAVGLRLLRAYQEYYNKHPKDSLGRAYLFEAARVADAMGKYQKAIDLLVNYHDGMENIHKKAEAVYMIAFIYDAHLHNEKKAIEYYNRVIELYPKSTWAEQAKSALHLVGKSDEELLDFLKEKNSQPS